MHQLVSVISRDAACCQQTCLRRSLNESNVFYFISQIAFESSPVLRLIKSVTLAVLQRYSLLFCKFIVEVRDLSDMKGYTF